MKSHDLMKIGLLALIVSNTAPEGFSKFMWMFVGAFALVGAALVYCFFERNV